jgi:hypothetical protein
MVQLQKNSKTLGTIFGGANVMMEFWTTRNEFIFHNVRCLLANHPDARLSAFNLGQLSHKLFFARPFISRFGVSVFQLTLRAT